MKNCGKRFHVQIAQKDFLQELIKIIGPKNDPPTVVQEKILSLIQVSIKYICTLLYQKLQKLDLKMCNVKYSLSS